MCGGRTRCSCPREAGRITIGSRGGSPPGLGHWESPVGFERDFKGVTREGKPRTASTALSRSVAMARLSTKASAPALITASRTLCSSWTLRTITLRSGQFCRSACNQFSWLSRSQGEIHDRHVGLEAACALDQRRLVGHHDHRSERRREQPAHAFRETVVAVRQQHTTQRLRHRGASASANRVGRDACWHPASNAG